MSDTLTITDNRTGKQYEIPIVDGTIRAIDLRQIKVDPEEFGMMSYDPAYLNTASCRSRITFIDGDRGILRYRGYPIEQLAERSTFLETAWLLVNGELPTAAELDAWTAEIDRHALNGRSALDSHVQALMGGFPKAPIRWACSSPPSARSPPSSPKRSRCSTPRPAGRRWPG